MKRFTETQKWSDPWFRRLSPAAKHLWQWLLDACDHAGIVQPDLELASFQIGDDVTTNTLAELGDRIVQLDSTRWAIPKFIPFQYGNLSEKCPAHRPVFQSLQKHHPLLEKHTLALGYAKGINTLKDKDKDKDKDKTEKVSWNKDGFQNISPDLRGRWVQAYPACNIDRQIAAAHEWLLANPQKAPKKSYQRFIVNWLSRAQERGGDTTSTRPQDRTFGFHSDKPQNSNPNLPSHLR